MAQSGLKLCQLMDAAILPLLFCDSQDKLTAASRDTLSPTGNFLALSMCFLERKGSAACFIVIRASHRGPQPH